MAREGYLEGVVSVTEVLAWGGYYDQYRDNPDGYYFRRGNFVDPWCTYVARHGATRFMEEMQRRPQAYELAWRKQRRPQSDDAEEQWINFVYAYAKWFNRHNVRLLEAQVHVYHSGLVYQGKLDHVAIVDDKLTLIDLKTNADGPPIKATALQTAAYELASHPVERRLGLALHPNATFDEAWYDRHYKDTEAWRALMQAYNIHGPRSDYR